MAKQIEQLVQEHIAASRKVAAEALERAFASSAVPHPRAQRSRSSAGPKRRTPEAMETVGERLYAAVCANPGETMRVLAAVVGASPRELQAPAGRLKRAGMLRSVGQRQGTRYFPIAKGPSKG